MILLYKLLYKVLTIIKNINKCMEIIFVERKEKNITWLFLYTSDNNCLS